MLRFARRLARLRFFAWLLSHPTIDRLAWPVLVGSLVDHTALFVIREYCKRREVCRYKLRVSGITIFLRHGTPDLATLAEIFLERVYDLPPEVRRYVDDLDRPPRVLDLGANIGLFGAFIFGLYPAADLVAFEPDAENTAIHRLMLGANDMGGRWRLTQAAALNRGGEVSFSGGGNVFSHIADSETGQQVAAIDVLPRLVEVDLAKIDIEGGEWEILSDPRFPSLCPAALVLEYHSTRSPAPDPRSVAFGLLTRAGYQVTATQERASEYGQFGILWAWKTEIAARPARG